MSSAAPPNALLGNGPDIHMADTGSPAPPNALLGNCMAMNTASTGSPAPPNALLGNGMAMNTASTGSPAPPNVLPENRMAMDMASTGFPARQEMAADAQGSQPTNNSGTSEGDEIESYTPTQREEEVVRILSWPDWAYYEILEVPETATHQEIERAFRKKSFLTHTDHNGDRDAEEVFKRK
jgi:hypothetical protein